MNVLPLLISVPHGGVTIPPEVNDICILEHEDIVADGDDGAREIYSIQDRVTAFVTAGVARAIVDVNRSPDDRRDDGVVKRITIWNKPVYRLPPDENVIRTLLSKYYEPYHQQLSTMSKKDVILGIDCHTMVAEAPPIDAVPGKARPDICLSNGDGTCPEDMLLRLRSCLEKAFQRNIAINDPFRGGYIIRSHAAELPWVQLEMARRDFMTIEKKRECIVKAFSEFCMAI
jgi:N-formylglutamate deformylase